MTDAPHDREMTLLEHLRELRHRLVISGIATGIGFAIAATFLTRPIMELLAGPAGMPLVALRPTEYFITYMRVALISGAALAMPVIVTETLLFVLPALHTHEKRYMFLAVPSITVAFAIGLGFGFFIVIPSALRFLVTFAGDSVQALWSIEEYLSFVSSFLFWIGISFETPLVLFFLVKLGVVSLTTLRRYRRYALVAAFVVGALITPTPDPLNQLLVSIPLYLLYELGMLLARFAGRPVARIEG